MARDIRVTWDNSAIRALGSSDPRVRSAMDRWAAGAVVTMKALCPVSPVGSLHVSGRLRSSIHAFREADGNIIVGPTAPYAPFVNNGTRPHIIRSHGPWPLRNRETGDVFGRVVHHPGNAPRRFIERTAIQLGGRIL